jgi:hypothetical protein
VRVLEILPNDDFRPLPTEMKYSIVSEIIKNRKATRAIKNHINEITGGNQIQINNRVIDILYQNSIKILQKNYNSGGLFQPPIKTSELSNLQLTVEDVKNEIIARYKDQQITVDNFLNRLKDMPPFHRPQLDTRRRMMQSIIDLIRGDILYQQAKNSKLPKNPDFKELIDKLNEELLSTEFRRRLHDQRFKADYPEAWEQYQAELTAVKKSNKVKIFEDVLFRGYENADSTYAPTPIPVFLKSAYNW